VIFPLFFHNPQKQVPVKKSSHKNFSAKIYSTDGIIRTKHHMYKHLYRFYRPGRNKIRGYASSCTLVFADQFPEQSVTLAKMKLLVLRQSKLELVTQLVNHGSGDEIATPGSLVSSSLRSRDEN